MANDQNSIAKDLRSVNMNRTVVDDPRVAAGVRSSETFFPNSSREVSSPRSRFCLATIATADSGGLGFQNSAFIPRQPLEGAIPGSRAGGEAASDDGNDDSSANKKVKFFCSFGGKILPRPSDGALRYVGGQTRIISVRRNISFRELMQKMVDICGHQSTHIKYQLPGEDLDALVSVSCRDDLENMMEEYERVLESSPEGSGKLRVFLFTPSDLDSVTTEVQDSGQRYVEAVNGIPNTVGGIRRKDSVASANSQTSNSEMTACEIGDNSGAGLAEGEVVSPPLISPTGVVTNDPSRLVYVPGGVMITEQLAVPGNLAPILTMPLQATRAERELDRAVPVAGKPLGYDIQLGMVDFHPRAAYVPAYGDLHQDPIGRVDCPHNAAQISFVSHQPVGLSGHVYRHADYPQQLRDNVVGVRAHPYLPGGQMTPAPTSPCLGFNQNGSQQFLQPHHTWIDPYVEENSTVPTDPNYKAFQAQPQPSAPLPGQTVEQYGWRPPPLPDEWVPQQHGVLPEKMLRLEDCYLCQNALPHAHSDTMIQEEVSGTGSTISETNPAFYRCHSDSAKPQPPPHRVIVTSPMVDDLAEHLNERALGVGGANIEFHGAGSRLRFVGHADLAPHEVASPQLGRFSQVPEGQHESERIPLQRGENPDPRTLLPPGVLGSPSETQVSYGMFQGNLPHIRHEDTLLHLTGPPQYQVNQYIAMNKTAGFDMPPVKNVPVQTSEWPVRDSTTECPGKLPSFTPQDNVSDTCFSYDHLRPIDTKMEALSTNEPEIPVANEQYRSRVTPNLSISTDIRPESTPQVIETGLQIAEASPLSNANTGKKETSDNRPQKAGKDKYVANAVKAAAIPDRNYVGLNDAVTPGGGSVLFSIANTGSAAGLVGDNRDLTPSNTFFGNQDPWNLHQDKHFPPPRPLKVGSKEALGPRATGGESSITTQLNEGEFYQPGDGSSSIKGSAEELIKQELQAVAEGVAASVLQSSIPASDVVLSGHDTNVSSAEPNQEREIHLDEENKPKLLDKNGGVPITEGISRLQIIKNCDLEELRELGSGTFGTVYHGKWRGTDVAIKRINDRCFAGKQSEEERLRADFWNEACKLADLHHPNVVAFYGVVLDGPGGSVATVTEYMVNGSLRHALVRNDRTLDRRKRFLIAMDVAFGMEYLHGKNIVHFDLKSDNLLVNLRDPQRPICKVGDLGLSKVKCKTLISGGVRGTLPWMAPELLNGSSSLVSEKVDVFSFGIVMWELLTGEEPYADLHYGAIIGGIVSNTLRPPVPESCEPNWRSLMEKCWSSEPSGRPSFTEIASTLRQAAQQQHTAVQAQEQK